jgi:RecA-family ATPase
MSADELAFSEHVDNVLASAFFEPAWLLARAALKQDFLIEGAIPRRAVTLLAGAPGEKKSWLGYAAAMAVARGEPWLDFDAPAPGRVLVANYDNPTSELGRRFLRMGTQANDSAFRAIKVPGCDDAIVLRPQGLIFHTQDDSRSTDGMLRLPDPRAVATLHAINSRLRPAMILIDSLRQSHTADENSSQEMALVMAALKGLTQYGAAVVVIHHSKKPNAKGDDMGGLMTMRGSGEIAGSADAAIVVADNVATWVKHRGWEIPFGEAAREFVVEDEGDLTRVREIG